MRTQTATQEVSVAPQATQQLTAQQAREIAREANRNVRIAERGESYDKLHAKGVPVGSKIKAGAHHATRVGGNVVYGGAGFFAGVWDGITE